MQEKKSALMSKLTKTLALGVPAVVLSGFMPLDAVSTDAAAEHHGNKYSSEAKSEAEAEGKKWKKKGAEAKAEAEGEAKAEAEGEAKKY